MYDFDESTSADEPELDDGLGADLELDATLEAMLTDGGDQWFDTHPHAREIEEWRSSRSKGRKLLDSIGLVRFFRRKRGDSRWGFMDSTTAAAAALAPTTATVVGLDSGAIAASLLGGALLFCSEYAARLSNAEAVERSRAARVRFEEAMQGIPQQLRLGVDIFLEDSEDLYGDSDEYVDVELKESLRALNELRSSRVSADRILRG